MRKVKSLTWVAGENETDVSGFVRSGANALEVCRLFGRLSHNGIAVYFGSGNVWLPLLGRNDKMRVFTSLKSAKRAANQWWWRFVLEQIA